jgi:Fe-S-cluster containining protein
VSTPDCLTCGACCHGDEGWVPVDGRDEEHVRASPELARNLVFVRHGSLVRRSLRMIGERCFALAVRGAGAGAEVACRVYPDRPTACRELLAGSSECLESRRLRGVG